MPVTLINACIVQRLGYRSKNATLVLHRELGLTMTFKVNYEVVNRWFFQLLEAALFQHILHTAEFVVKNYIIHHLSLYHQGFFVSDFQSL